MQGHGQGAHRLRLGDLAADAAGVHTADLLAPGEQFAGRRVVGLLGRGSSAQVYRVDGAGGAEEALKVVLPGVARDEVGRARFGRECEIAGTLRHPNGLIAIEGVVRF